MLRLNQYWESQILYWISQGMPTQLFNHHIYTKTQDNNCMQHI
uniref:Uncharacterized protein n=1 Tax=Rhizophora mucronata TaxID=61149 RepID=A0A2P2QAF3_RHIMU